MVDQIPGMDEYVQAVSESRLDDAKRHLVVAISATKQKGAEAVRAGIAQRFGELCLAQGDIQGAIFLHELSEVLDENSLLAKLDYAKFLFQKMNDKGRATAKCDEIIQQAQSHPFPGTDDDFSSQEYVDAALRLKGQIQTS